MRDECEHGSLRRKCGYCERDDMIKDAHDALRHIIATVNQSRTQSRRLRWIAVRAQDGIDGTTEHQRVDLPKSASQSEVRLRIKCVKLKARIAELEAENENLRTVMIAAAEEIKLRWEAHCDPVEGLGPVNLLRRLECGIPAEYGYKAGNFRRLMYRVKALEAALTPFADAAAHIPEEAEMLDVGYMLDGEAGCEPVAFEGVAFHRARALLQEAPDA